MFGSGGYEIGSHRRTDGSPGPMSAAASSTSAPPPPSASSAPGAANPWAPPPPSGGQDGRDAAGGFDRSGGTSAFRSSPYGPPPHDDPFTTARTGGSPFDPPPRTTPPHGPATGPRSDGEDPAPAFSVPPGSPGSPDSPNRSGRRGRLPLLIGGAVVGLLVLVAGGIGLSAILKDDDAKPSAGSSPAGGAGAGAAGSTAPSTGASPSSSPSTALGALLKSRATDPSPLAVAEIFKRKTFTVQGRKYVMTARRATTACAATVKGTTFAATLRKAGCTQLIRATFARSDGKLVGTVGVLNLRTDAAAKAAARAAAARDAYVLPLAGTGATGKVGTGVALGTTETRGHYLLTTWVQLPNGKEIPATLRPGVSAFGRDVALGSNLTTALQYRGITGKPYGR